MNVIQVTSSVVSTRMSVFGQEKPEFIQETSHFRELTQNESMYTFVRRAVFVRCMCSCHWVIIVLCLLAVSEAKCDVSVLSRNM